MSRIKLCVKYLGTPQKTPTTSLDVKTASLIVIPEKRRPGIEKFFQGLHPEKDGIGVSQVIVLGPL